MEVLSVTTVFTAGFTALRGVFREVGGILLTLQDGFVLVVPAGFCPLSETLCSLSTDILLHPPPTDEGEVISSASLSSSLTHSSSAGSSGLNTSSFSSMISSFSAISGKALSASQSLPTLFSGVCSGSEALSLVNVHCFTSNGLGESMLRKNSFESAFAFTRVAFFSPEISEPPTFLSPGAAEPLDLVFPGPGELFTFLSPWPGLPLVFFSAGPGELLAFRTGAFPGVLFLGETLLAGIPEMLFLGERLLVDVSEMLDLGEVVFAPLPETLLRGETLLDPGPDKLLLGEEFFCGTPVTLFLGDKLRFERPVLGAGDVVPDPRPAAVFVNPVNGFLVLAVV